MNKQDVIDQLKSGTTAIEFTKVNGDPRIMICTLNEDIVPPATKEDPLTQKKVRAINEEVQVVWSVDSSGWRSFRWDSLTRVGDTEVSITLDTTEEATTV